MRSASRRQPENAILDSMRRLFCGMVQSTMKPPKRIAMWSGPRNISTAMMRSWGQRPDTIVCDEPLYAYYLRTTKLDHPGRDEVIAHHESDWRKVVDWLTGPVPNGRGIFYQKHMAHHLLPEVGRDWLPHLTHGLLIRRPDEMLTSLIQVLPNPRLIDTGLPQQIEIATLVETMTGRFPPIVDSRDVLEDPRRMLTLLCEAMDVAFMDDMLSWPPGRRETDGIWAKHWYAVVERSTAFEPYRPKDEKVPEHLRPLLDECMGCYEILHGRRLGR